MTNLQNTFRRLIIIVLSLSYDAYHHIVFVLTQIFGALDQNDTLKLLP